MQEIYLKMKEQGITEDGFEELYCYSLAEYWLEDIDTKTALIYKVYNNRDEVKYDLEVMKEIVENTLRLRNTFGRRISLFHYVYFCTAYYGEIRNTDIFALFTEIHSELQE